MHPIVMYHASCNDGFCAAWLFWRYIDKQAEFIPVKYGDDSPDVEDRDVLILDFSFSREVLMRMKEKAKTLIVLDHHKTAESDLKKLDFCVFDMNKSGARLSWESFCEPLESFGQLKIPWLVEYTEDRDLWRWELDQSKAVSAALSSYEWDFQVWENVFAGGLTALKKEGEAILRDQANTIRKSVLQATPITLLGHKVLCVNSTTLVSEIGHELAKDAPFGVVWFATEDKIVYGLRSTDTGVDVSAIANQFGGGGHRNAAGFSIPFALPIP